MSSIVIPRATRPPPEIVVYVDPSKRKKANPNPKAEDDATMIAERGARSGRGPKEISMKRARFDVHKFGISGFAKEKKEEAKVQLAVDLGAKPPKNKHYNYKEFIAMKKVEKAAELESRHRNRALGIKVKKTFGAKSRGKSGPKGLNCQVGRYKDGMQMIPKRLIKKSGGK